MSNAFNLEPVAAISDALSAAHALPSLSPLGAAALAVTGAPAPSAQFGSIVSQGLESVNTQLASAETSLQSLAVGGAGNLHEVMVSMEGAKLAFQLVAQVRNQVLSAYQDVVKMQI
jgi:flagellar hook-basal body complex protein FliE